MGGAADALVSVLARHHQHRHVVHPLQTVRREEAAKTPLHNNFDSVTELIGTTDGVPDQTSGISALQPSAFSPCVQRGSLGE